MTARILLAEDNHPLSQMLQRFLAARGFHVLAAKTGTEALQILASEEIHLLLLDLRLPELNGVQVLQKLRTTPRWRTLPVVVMTGIYKGGRFTDAARKSGKAGIGKEGAFQKDIRIINGTCRCKA